MKYDLIETERLYLDQFGEKDLDFLFNHFSNLHVFKYLYDNEPPKNLLEAKNILAWCMDYNSKDHIRWCIKIKKENKQIGTCGFHYYDKKNNSAKIGYDLSYNYWRQGLMLEALSKMVLYGFKNYSLNRIYAYVAVENLSSNKLLENLGFRLEGTFRE